MQQTCVRHDCRRGNTGNTTNSFVHKLVRVLLGNCIEFRLNELWHLSKESAESGSCLQAGMGATDLSSTLSNFCSKGLHLGSSALDLLGKCRVRLLHFRLCKRLPLSAHPSIS